MEAPIPNPRILVRVCVRAVTARKIKGLDHGLRNSSGNLAIFTAIRRASSLLIVDFEFGGIARKPLLLFGKCVVIFGVT